MFRPPLHRGMTILDRTVFRLRVPLLALKVPAKNCTEYVRKFAGYIQRRLDVDSFVTIF